MKLFRSIVVLILVGNTLLAMDAPTPGKRKFEPTQESESQSQLPKRTAVPETAEELQELQQILNEANPTSSEEGSFAKSSQEQIQKRFATFPAPIKEIIVSSGTADEAGQKIRELMNQDKKMREFIEAPQNFPILLDVITERLTLTGKDREGAALALGTQASQKWLQTNSLMGLPSDLKLLILSALASATYLGQATSSINQLAQKNKIFNTLLNNRSNVRLLINYLSKEYKTNTLRIAQYLELKETAAIKHFYIKYLDDDTEYDELSLKNFEDKLKRLIESDAIDLELYKGALLSYLFTIINEKKLYPHTIKSLNEAQEYYTFRNIIWMLIKNNPNIVIENDDYGIMTPLFKATHHISLFEELLKAGADPNLGFFTQSVATGDTRESLLDHIRGKYANLSPSQRYLEEALLLEYGAKTYEEIHEAKRVVKK